VGYSYVIPKFLAQGSRPIDGSPIYHAFDTVVLCAEEHQDVRLPGVEVIYAPFDDSGPPPTAKEVQTAWNAAKRVARRVRANRRVLVTCAKGWNRSGLVTGFTLIILGLSADQAVDVIRMARGPSALHNRYFVKLLRGVRPTAAPPTSSVAAP